MDIDSTTFSSPLGHLQLLRKRPRPQNDAFFSEGKVEYKIAWLRLADSTTYLPQVQEQSNDCPEDNQSPLLVCHMGQCHGQEFTNAVVFEHHYDTRHRFLCQTCEASFPSEMWLDFHIREIHDVLVQMRREQGEQTYQCFVQGCDRVCSTHHKRQMHLIDKHKYPKSFNFAIVAQGFVPFKQRMQKLNQRRRPSATFASKAGLSGSMDTTSPDGDSKAVREKTSFFAEWREPSSKGNKRIQSRHRPKTLEQMEVESTSLPDEENINKNQRLSAGSSDKDMEMDVDVDALTASIGQLNLPNSISFGYRKASKSWAHSTMIRNSLMDKDTTVLESSPITENMAFPANVTPEQVKVLPPATMFVPRNVAKRAAAPSRSKYTKPAS